MADRCAGVKADGEQGHQTGVFLFRGFLNSVCASGDFVDGLGHSCVAKRSLQPIVEILPADQFGGRTPVPPESIRNGPYVLVGAAANHNRPA